MATLLTLKMNFWKHFAVGRWSLRIFIKNPFLISFNGFIFQSVFYNLIRLLLHNNLILLVFFIELALLQLLISLFCLVALPAHSVSVHGLLWVYTRWGKLSPPLDHVAAGTHSFAVVGPISVQATTNDLLGCGPSFLIFLDYLCSRTHTLGILGCTFLSFLRISESLNSVQNLWTVNFEVKIKLGDLQLRATWLECPLFLDFIWLQHRSWICNLVTHMGCSLHQDGHRP